MTFITAKWTIAEYHQMIAVGILSNRKIELLHGEIVEMLPEGVPHAYCCHEAGEYLIKLLGEHAKVRQAKPITFGIQNPLRTSALTSAPSALKKNIPPIPIA